MTTKVKCPYCGKEVAISVEDGQYFQKQIATCYIDDGGCDKDFVVDTYISISAKCKKIEGEDNGEI
jgi:hypothetical protein